MRNENGATAGNEGGYKDKRQLNESENEGEKEGGNELVTSTI